MHFLITNNYKLTNFLKNKDGSATIEFVLWTPFFVTLLVLIAEVSFLFTVNSSMWNVTRDVARRLAFHQIEAAQAHDAVMDHAFFQRSGYVVHVHETVEHVTLTVSLPIRDAAFLGMVADRFRGDLVARISMLREPV